VKIMFGKDESEKLATLGAMQGEALRQANFHHGKAREQLVSRIKIDRRFDDLDAERLADQVFDCSQSGKRLDLNDPFLQPGGQPRPKARRGLW
jgi:hypothetical protein